MNDRISTYPGRIKLTDESTGAFKYYTMEMADEATEVGTPLNKEHLLTDTTVAEILAKCGTAPDDINTALSTINSKILKFKTGSFAGRNTATQSILDESPPSVSQSITGIGFEPQILILRGASLYGHDSGQYMVRRNYTEVLLRGESSHMMTWIYVYNGWYDERKVPFDTATPMSGGLDNITWSGDTVSWDGWWTRAEHFDGNGYFNGYIYTLFDNYNLSGRTYYYTAIGL